MSEIAGAASPHGVAVVATLNEVEFVRYFAARCDARVWVFDEGEAALDAQRRLQARYVFSDATALRDGLTGYRLAKQLRAEQPAACASHFYLFANPELFHEHRVMLNRIGVERVLPRSPMMVAQVLGHRLRADPAPPPGPSGTSVAVAAAHASLHRLVGPVASKLIERVRQDPASAQAGIAAYVERLASEIRIPSLRESFLQAMRGLHD